MAAWAPLVPFAKTRIGIDDGSLGLLLLCIGAGSMLAMPLTGFLTGKLGCRAVILMAGLGLCIDLPLLALMDSLGGMAVALLLFGAAIGMIDVAMNVQAVIVERASGKAMMSGFHGFFSIGGIAGAGGVSALLWLGLTPLQSTLLTVLAVIVLLALASRHLLRERRRRRRADVRLAARLGDVHRHPVLYHVSGGRIDARLERAVPHHAARRRA